MKTFLSISLILAAAYILYLSFRPPATIHTDNQHIIDSLNNEIKTAKGRIDTIEIEIKTVIMLRDTVEKEIERYTPEQTIQAWDSLTVGNAPTELTELGAITEPERIKQGVKALVLIPSLRRENALLYGVNAELKGIIITQENIIELQDETIKKQARQIKVYRAVGVVGLVLIGLLAVM